MGKRKELLIQAKKSCEYQGDLSIDSIKRYIRCVNHLEKLDTITTQTIVYLGKTISPKNLGFRTTPASFRNLKVAISAPEIRRQISLLTEAQNSGNLTPRHFYHLFEEIHPYNDGNGRVGEILYHWMTGSWETPKIDWSK